MVRIKLLFASFVRVTPSKVGGVVSFSFALAMLKAEKDAGKAATTKDATVSNAKNRALKLLFVRVVIFISTFS
jgi:hypothetical protein